MKKTALSLLAAAVFIPAAVAANFEGKVTFKITPARGKAQEMRYAMKGDKIRMEFPDQKEMGGMILDTVKQEMMMIMDSQRMYMVMPVPQQAGDAAQSGPQAKLEKTGKTERILGYTAEQYISTQDGNKTELWLAEGLGTFALGNPNAGGGRGGGPAGMPQGWERALAGKPLFPLRVIGFDKGSKESFRMEVTSIDKQALPDGMFTPPAEYQRMDMGAMMQGAMPGMQRGTRKR